MRAAAMWMVASALGVLWSWAAWAEAPREFELPDHGTLTLVVPNGWDGVVNQPVGRLPPTILLKPKEGPGGKLLITVLWPIAPVKKLPDDAGLRAEVAASAKKLEGQSVEGKLVLQDLMGASGNGFYFAATDRSPKLGEYKYLNQGIIRAGDIALAFTILTNDGESAVVRAALSVLRTAGHK